MGFLLAQMEKNLSAMQDTLVQSLGREDPLERGMATHSSILTWRIIWTEEPGWLTKDPSFWWPLQWITATRVRSCTASKRPSNLFYGEVLVVNIPTSFQMAAWTCSMWNLYLESTKIFDFLSFPNCKVFIRAFSSVFWANVWSGRVLASMTSYR